MVVYLKRGFAFVFVKKSYFFFNYLKNPFKMLKIKNVAIITNPSL